MAETVRIEPGAHAALAEIARAKHITLTQALTHAVEALRREVFLERLNAGYARLRSEPTAWKDEEKERALWELSVADGLEGEPRYPLRATGAERGPTARRKPRKRARARGSK